MRYLGSIMGYAIAGMFVMNGWGFWAAAYGIAGGWAAGFVIIFLCWTLNHFAGVVFNAPDAAWVDMATGIAVTGTMRDVFDGMDISLSLPTLACVAIGGVIGGACAGLVKKAMAADAA